MTDGCHSFLWVACQPESQSVCKEEILRSVGGMRFAFSRPGLMTFKVDDGANPREDLDLKSTFARTYGWSLGNLEPQQPDRMSQQLQTWLQDPSQFRHLHVWPRAQKKTVEFDAEQVANAFRAAIEDPVQLELNQVVERGTQVLDLIVVGDNHWLLGRHRAFQVFQRWPGGVPIIQPPPESISRAYLKTAEALLWSGLPIRAGDQCAEIGSAPGGSCQRLLELGARVIAIDPADLDPRVADHPQLRHIKKRGRDVRHRDLQEVRWLLADSNVAPDQTLDTVEQLTRGERIHFQGLLLTLKLPDWSEAARAADFIQRVKSWGFRYVKSRQLAYGGREICLMALRNKAVRRFR